MVAEVSYTIRSRRAPRETQTSTGSRFIVRDLQPEVAAPARPVRPFGDLSAATPESIAELSRGVLSSQDSQVKKRFRGTRDLLLYLSSYPGDTWQERWCASGHDDADKPISACSAAPNEYKGYELTAGLQALFLMRVIQPSLVGFRANKFGHYADYFERSQGDDGLTRYFRAVEESRASARFQAVAKFDASVLMTTQGLAFSDITPAALLHYSLECRRRGLTLGAGKSGSTKFAGLLAWDVMFNMGHFPPDTPMTLRASLYGGQKTAEQLVDHYQLENDGVRDLLVDYLRRRQADTDYSTRKGLAMNLAGYFWKNIEKIAPGQADLRLPEELYEQWREVIKLRQDGTPRVGGIQGILLPVRAMYMDVQSWALEEPERWGRWAAPCPIPQRDLRGFGKRRRQIKERVDDRIRVRQPLLPLLVAHVEERLGQASSLLAEARRHPLGGAFTHNGVRFERTDSRVDRQNHELGDYTVRVRIVETGQARDLVAEEDAAFWEWAYVEVLRHTGIRVEELVELSHTSLRQYRRPNGELIALLVIAPSKADRERVIPCSPELFHVLALIVRRQTAHGPVPLLARYDGHEQELTSPLPYLFQRQIGSVRRVVSTSTVLNALRAASERAAQTAPALRGVHFTPHDFRRLFATEVVNNNLPIHIGAALLGHLNIETTRGYTGVFEEDVIRHYQEYLGRRRTERPQEEYRPATPEEWSEFEEHFDKRKVELGSCGRPYGTPCQHEHSCIRCPMLHVNPKMLPRLDELEADLLDRRERAEQQGWRGELEGIDLTLQMLRAKREETQRLTRTTEQISLGMPSVGAP